MSNQITRREFAIRTAGLGLAMGLVPAARVADAEQAAHAEASPAIPDPHSLDPYSVVDPELLPALKQFPAYDLSMEMVVKFRQMPGMLPLPAPAPQPVERHIPGPPGAPEVRLWVVDPAPSQKGKPVLLHMHGGGFMMTDPMLMPELQGIATDCHCVVVSVDYRLAPVSIAPELPWAVRAQVATTQRASRFAPATATRSPSSSSCSSTPRWTTERAAPVQRRPPLANSCGLRVPIVLPGARCSVFQQARPACRPPPSPPV